MGIKKIIKKCVNRIYEILFFGSCLINIKKKHIEKDERIIVSLTSYPPRLKQLHKTIISILAQSMQPDEIVLYLGDDCKGLKLPRKLIGLKKYNFKIIYKPENLKPHKKYYYAFQEYPNDIIITIDDDALYERDMIKQLYESHKKYPNAVCAKRVHCMLKDETGLLPYCQWKFECTDILEPSHELVPTGCGGVLYVPKLFGDILFDKDLIGSLALTVDDIWLKYMEILFDIPVVFVPGKRIHPIALTDKVYSEDALCYTNVGCNKNDVAINDIKEKLKINLEEYAREYEKSKLINFISAHSLVGRHKTGVQFHDLNIIQSLRELGYKVNVYSMASKQNDDDVMENIIYPRTRTRLNKYLTWRIMYGKKAPRKGDTIIFDSFIPEKIRLSDYKTYAILHDLMPKIFPDNYEDLRPYYNYLDRIQDCDYILANSVSTKKDYINYYSVDPLKIKVVPCCVTNAYKEQMQTLSKSARNTRWINLQYFYYIGDMRKNKNLDKAIEAFFLFQKKRQDYYFVIAGKKAKEYDKLVEKYENEPAFEHLIFTGYIDDSQKASLIIHSKALIFVSDYEGFGIPIIEAMACGVPVITTNGSSMKEIAGGCALLVNPKESNDIANAMTEIINDEIKSQLVIKAEENVQKYTQNSQKMILSKYI